MSLNLDKSSWKHVTLGEVASASKERVDPGTGVVERYVAGEHMDTDDLQIHRWGEIGDGYLGPAFHRRFHPGQVLYGSRRTYLRKVAVADFDGVTANTTYVVSTRDERVLSQDFLPFIMTSEPFHAFAIQESKGSVNPYVNWSDLERFEFDLPPLDDQKRIADLLWAIEHHRLAANSQAVGCRRVADEAFGSALAATAVENILLPKLMNEMTVGVVVRPTQYYTDEPTGVPALRGLNIEPGGFNLADLVRFRPESMAELKKSTLDTGDVVIVRTGRPGDAAVVTEEVAGFNCIDLIIARPGPDLDADFLAYFLNSTYGRRQIARLSAGTAQQHFNVGALKKLEIPQLSIDEQRRLVGRVEQVREVEALAHEEAERVRGLKVAVLADVFGGY